MVLTRPPRRNGRTEAASLGYVPRSWTSLTASSTAFFSGGKLIVIASQTIRRLDTNTDSVCRADEAGNRIGVFSISVVIVPFLVPAFRRHGSRGYFSPAVCS